MAPIRKDLSPDFRKPRAVLVALLLAGTATLAMLMPTAAAATPYRPPEMTNSAVQDATLSVALEYANAVPGLDAKTLRWFLYSIEHRESTFSTTFCNYHDGAGGWNSPKSSFWPTTDHLPHGCGLTQLTGWRHEGMPYPNGASTAPTSLDKGIYGWVSPPRAITSLSTPFDAKQNLRRFVTEEVLPDFIGIHKMYPSYSTDQVLRAVAFHWNKGEYQRYDPNNCDYLCGYDAKVAVYKPAVLSDSAWPGTGTTTTSTSGSTTTSTSGSSSTTNGVTFTVSPNVNAYWIEVKVSPTASSVRVSIDGGAPISLSPTTWGSWSKSTHVTSGSRVVFTATVNGATATSTTTTWP